MPELREFDGVQLIWFFDAQPRPGVTITPGRIAFDTMEPAVTYRDLIKLLEADGWYFERTAKGAHMVYRHATKPGSIVVAHGGKLGRDVPTGTQNAILRQAGLK
jgi:predicted RNA binding protein YcfA (HicA-like mRNA interferase family)